MDIEEIRVEYVYMSILSFYQAIFIYSDKKFVLIIADDFVVVDFLSTFVSKCYNSASMI